MIYNKIECGKKIPEKKFYSREDDYSGKLTLRMPKSLHKELAQAAEEQGVSINTLILCFLSKSIGQVKTETASSNDTNKACINFERILFTVSQDQDWEQNSLPPVFRNRMASPMFQNKNQEG
jgi:hypothetical protein